MVSAQVLEIKTARIVAASEFACRPETMMESALQMARALAKQMAAPLPEIDLKDIGLPVPTEPVIATGDLRWPTTAEQWGNVYVTIEDALVTELRELLTQEIEVHKYLLALLHKEKEFLIDLY